MDSTLHVAALNLQFRTLMKQYEVPMKRGIPGLAVLDADGKLVYSQKNGEFENARATHSGRFSGIPEQVETRSAEPVRL